jgi:hypothetical protein
MMVLINLGLPGFEKSKPSSKDTKYFVSGFITPGLPLQYVRDNTRRITKIMSTQPKYLVNIFMN